MTILITDEGDSLKQKNFNATCLLSEANVQRLCKKNAICKEHDGTLTDNLGRLYMPESNLLQIEVIQKHHDSPVAGHPGYEKTTHVKDSRDLTWPQQAFYTHLKPHHYHGNISQLISSQTFPSPTALTQS